MSQIESPVNVSRSYVDNFAVKDFTEKTLIPKYYPDVDVSTRSVGMVSFVTEQIATTTEDAFNTTSVLFRETFPNRAELPESIYSHAALFQLTNIFSTACACNFLLVLEEETIIKHMTLDKNTGISYFYIDKNTVIYVEEIPFILDYDIELRVITKTTETGKEYLFSASYVFDNKNMISDLKDPYIKIRRSGDGLMALDVHAHQALRNVVYESIVTNSKINYPYIDITFTGKIAGFDVFYKTSADNDFNTQMDTLLVYSQPLETPFCYYQLLDDGVLRLSFTSKDTYFMPDFNSELKIVLYSTLGADGKFDEYTGSNITIVPDSEKYDYASTYIIAAKPITSSTGGVDQLTLEALQSLSVLGYRTANALTTDADLNEYFKNYKYLYGNNEMRFFKRRNDAYERLYCCYNIISNDKTIYKTNTLNLDLNLSDMVHLETGVYVIEPGTLFTSPGIGEAAFYRNQEDEDKWYAEYLEDVKNGNAQFVNYPVEPDSIPTYFDRACSYSEWKRRKGYSDTYDASDLTEEELYRLDDPANGKYLYVNPFLIRFTKTPSVVTTYLTHISQKSLVDFTGINNDSFVQFVMYQCELTRFFGKEKVYNIKIILTPTITLEKEVNKNFPIALDENENPILNDKFSVENNDLRVIFVTYNNGRPVGYTELYPTDYDGTSSITFEGHIHTDDHITSDNKMRLLSNTIYRNKTDGSYYMQNDNDHTVCTRYDKNGNILETGIEWDFVHEKHQNGELSKYSEMVNMSGGDDMLIPLADVTCKIFMLYDKVYDYSSESKGLIDCEEGDNQFIKYDSSLSNYIWTNEYTTGTDPLTFIKPLDNVRINLEFKDYTEYDEVKNEYVHDIMDARIYSIPFIKYDIGLNKTTLSYFMETFLQAYENVTAIRNIKLRNQTDVDIKLYNTYGNSKNFIIGENNEILNTINISIEFDIWFVHGTDLIAAVAEVKEFIKKTIEQINDAGSNNLYISNLMRKIEYTYEYVDHIRFVRINNYSSDYQTIKSNISYIDDLTHITKEERRFYVPEILTVDYDNIIINDYTVS